MPTSFRAAPRTPLLLAVVIALCGLSSAAPGLALVRDVEVRPGASATGALTVEPAASLVRDVAEPVAWPVRVGNGSDVAVEVELSIHLAVPGEEREPAPGPVLSWALLPRDRLVLGPSDLADFTIELSPTDADLPAAVVLAVTTVGEDARTALATRVLWPAGHASAVRFSPATPGPGSDVDELHLLVEDTAGPSVVDVRVRSAAWPSPARQLDVGPLVLLPGAPRQLQLTAPTSLFGHRSQAVASIDGVEVARKAVSGPTNPWRVAMVAALALAILATAAAAIRTQRRNRP